MMRLRKIACAAVVALAGSTSMLAQEGQSTLEAGKIQVSVLFGNNTMFNQNYYSYLLPSFNGTSEYGSIGVGGSGSNHKSTDPGTYLNISDVGSNSAINMIGIQGQYFITSAIDVNAMFAMNIAATPKKDYQEGIYVQLDDKITYDGEYEINYCVVPAFKYIEGRLTTSWMANVGGNYHFTFSGSKVSAYAGVRLGAQMGRVQTTRPYTGAVGDITSGDTKQLLESYEVYYTEGSRLGQIWAFQGSIIGGLEYEFTRGFIFGFEVAPVAYQRSLIEVGPKGYEKFYASHNDVRIFATPNLKIGFRF